MIHTRIVSAASRIQRADAALIRAKSRLSAEKLLQEQKERERREGLESQIQEAKDFYEKKCYVLEEIDASLENARQEVASLEDRQTLALNAEHRAFQMLQHLKRRHAKEAKSR